MFTDCRARVVARREEKMEAGGGDPCPVQSASDGPETRAAHIVGLTTLSGKFVKVCWSPVAAAVHVYMHEPSRACTSTIST